MIGRLIPILLILIAIGLFFGYVNPTYSGHVAELKGEIRSYDDALKAAQAFSDKEDQILAERGQIPTEGLVRLESFLPDGVDNVQLILDLNALAGRSGLTLSDFDVAASSLGGGSSDRLPLEAEGPVESLDLTLSATGTYASFKTFLTGVEWSLRPLDLVELDIDDSATGVYTYRMKFRLYWLR